MTIQWENIQSSAGNMRAYTAQPKTKGNTPLILVLQHRGGVDEHMQDVVHRLYRSGYSCIAPELFHRQEANIDFSERVGLLKDDEIISDCRAAIDYSKQNFGNVSSIGVVGFCSGGRSAYLAATEIDCIDAATVFYGGNLKKPMGGDLSPFEKTKNINCPVLGFFGMDDKNPSPQDVANLSEELNKFSKWHEFHSYRDVGHAFHNFKSEYYRDNAAQSSWARMISFFDDILK